MDRQAASAALNGTLTPEFIQDAKNDNIHTLPYTRAAEWKKFKKILRIRMESTASSYS